MSCPGPQWLTRVAFLPAGAIGPRPSCLTGVFLLTPQAPQMGRLNPQTRALGRATTADSGGSDGGGSRSALGWATLWAQRRWGVFQIPTSLVSLTQDPAVWANPMLSQGVRQQDGRSQGSEDWGTPVNGTGGALSW